MGLLKLLKHTITTPVAIVQDIVTLGGTTNDKDEPYTSKKLKKIAKNINKLL